ncbi:MAG: alpha/beta fold hydrolase [Rhodothermales bacterium]
MNPVTHDPAAVDRAYPPTLHAFTFESGGHRLLGCIYVADGPGPHPTALLLHGCPGNERNFDLAHALRRAGFNVALFHYRGAWGSDGTFSIAGAVADVPAALAFLRDEAHAAALRIDPDRIVPVGHSMGGFVALMAAASDDRVPAVAGLAAFNFGLHARLMHRVPDIRARTLNELAPLMPPLQGATAEWLVEEMAARRADWNLLDRVPALRDRPVLLVAAERDETAIPLLHHRPLVDAFGPDAAGLTTTTLDDDHLFSSTRIALARTVAAWLRDGAFAA